MCQIPPWLGSNTIIIGESADILSRTAAAAREQRRSRAAQILSASSARFGALAEAAPEGGVEGVGVEMVFGAEVLAAHRRGPIIRIVGHTGGRGASDEAAGG